MTSTRPPFVRVLGRALPVRVALAATMLAGAYAASGALPGDHVPTSAAEQASAPAAAARVVQRPGWRVHATNTGLAPFGLTCSKLPVYHGPDHVRAGAVISHRRITHPLILSAGHIVISKSCMQPTRTWLGMAMLMTTNNTNGHITTRPVTIKDSEFDGSRLSNHDAAWTTAFLGIANLYRNYIHGFGSGIGLMNTGKKLSSVIEGNLVSHLVADGDPAGNGNHSDAFTVRDFSRAGNPQRTLYVRNNRFACDDRSCTGAFFIQTYAGNIDHLRMYRNLLTGEGYQLGLNQMGGNTYRNVRSVNNRFSGTGWGPTYVQGGPGWNVWSHNYINKPGVPGHRGRGVHNPS